MRAFATGWDPDHGTPLFSLDGGASSCAWEVGSAHRSAPTLKWKYIGPDLLRADQAALFTVTLSNAQNYYQAGVSSGKTRPGWTMVDYGEFPFLAAQHGTRLPVAASPV